jgi:hypothetical protein
MNERIKLLAEQAGAVFEKTNGLNDCPQDSLVDDEIQKFAELIVRECARVYWNIDDSEIHGEYVKALKKHFGVE